MSAIGDHDAHVRLPQKLGCRVPRGLPAAGDAAAKRRHQSPSEWVRQALLCVLEQDGVRLCDGRVLDDRSLANGEILKDDSQDTGTAQEASRYGHRRST